MKYIITESQVNNLMFEYINYELKGVRPFTNSWDDSDLLWWRNDEGVVAMYDISGNEIYILGEIWNRVKTMFSLDDEEIERSLIKWSKKYLKLKHISCIRKGAPEMNGWFMYGGSDITEN